MAERNPPRFVDVNDAYSGDELGYDLRNVLSEGVVDPDGGELEVTAGAGNSVNVAAGHCYVLGDTDPDFQPLYGMFNDAAVNKGISPDPSNPRKVLVVAQVTDEAFSGSGRAWSIDAIHGTPAGSPAEPALPDSALELALVDVPAAAADSSAYTITDRRVQYGLATLLSAPTGGVGTELDYAQITSDSSSITATTEGTAQTIITGNSIAYDGTKVRIEIWIPSFTTTGAGARPRGVLLRGATVLGQWRLTESISDAVGLGASVAVFYDTPSAASHTYAFKAFVDASAATIKAGAGGSGNLMPAFLRVTKA